MKRTQLVRSLTEPLVRLCGVLMQEADDRWSDIPLPAILETLKLKDLKAMVADLTPPSLTRKAQAVAYVLSLPDMKDRIGKVAAVQDLFQLQPLPEEFAQVDLERVASAWRYAREIAFLITATYTQDYDAVEQKHLPKELDPEVIGWKILAAEDACLYCKRAAERDYLLGQTPRVPLHIGCHCHISPHYALQSQAVYEPQAVEIS